MFPVTIVVVSVTSAKSPRILFTNRSKIIDQRYANSCKNGHVLARRHESEGHGFQSQCCKMSMRVFLHYNLVMAFVEFVSVIIKLVNVADVLKNTNKKDARFTWSSHHPAYFFLAGLEPGEPLCS